MRCDAHVHIVGRLEQYPQVATQLYVAAPAELDTLRRHGAARGISRFVIVQPSFYGPITGCSWKARRARRRGRGIAVVDAATPPDACDYARRGVPACASTFTADAERSRRRAAGAGLCGRSKLGRVRLARAGHRALPTLIDCAAMLPARRCRSSRPLGLYGRALPDSAKDEACWTS